jgi:ABC-type uncharacterized transport system permease subunit
MRTLRTEFKYGIGMNALLPTLSAMLYLVAALLLLRRLASGIQASRRTKYIALGMGLTATLSHLAALYAIIITQEGLNLNFFHVLSLTSWVAALLVLLSALKRPLENLGIALLPFTAITVILQSLSINDSAAVEIVGTGLKAHILISILSYGVLTLAALQAILLAILNRQLRNRHPGGFIRALPPLETMETLLFRLIGLGYTLLSLSLLTGVTYIEDIFAQHLVHKTVLSVAAWMVFAILLWGRWRFGWRGRTAVRWTLSGFVVLMLAYFGSKLVLELILHR